MRKILLAAALAGGMLAACTQKSNNNQNNEGMNTTLTLTQEWDKVFPLSEKVSHKKVTFETQYGLTLAADLYTPKDAKGKLAAIAVSGPFGAVKEQCSGLYAMKMAERGFVALAFDPSYTGESSGEPRRTASPDINTEDFMAAVDFLSKQENVDAEKIGIIGICGWGGIALNAAAADTRIKATVASTIMMLSTMSSGATRTARIFQSSVLPTPTQWLAVYWTLCHHRPPTSCTTTSTTTKRHAVITSVQATPTTAGVSSVLRPMPTAVSSITSTRSAPLFS